MMDTHMFSMTDAMVHCMSLPGAIAVAFVELETGRAIAGDGVDRLDIDTLTPSLTELLLGFTNSTRHNNVPCFDLDTSTQTTRQVGHVHSDTYEEVADTEVAITRKDRVDLLYPLSKEGVGLYIYLAMNRTRGNIILGHRCLSEINEKLRL